MRYIVRNREIIIFAFLFVFATLCVFWNIVFNPINLKYFSIVYLVLSITMLVIGTPFIFHKSAWAFFLFIIINFVALIAHVYDISSLINISTLIISYLSLYYFVVGGIKYLGFYEFENIAFKYTQYVLLISLIVSPILTLLKWPYAPEYFPWDALLTDKRFLLIIGQNVGHSNAMWLIAFSAAFIIRNLHTPKKNMLNLIRILILLLLSWGLVATKSRTALLFLIILLLEWATYNKLLSRRLYAAVPIIGLLLFFLGVMYPLFRSNLEVLINILQSSFPSVRFISSNTNSISIYSGRDILNSALISSFVKNPWFGSGHSSQILLYGVNKYGNIAYHGNMIGMSESMLRMLVKYGLFYFTALLTFILIPLIRAFKGYYKDNIFVISVCSIILISGINGSIFENLYDISGLFVVFILIFLIIPKYNKGCLNYGIPKSSYITSNKAIFK